MHETSQPAGSTDTAPQSRAYTNRSQPQTDDTPASAPNLFGEATTPLVADNPALPAIATDRLPPAEAAIALQTLDSEHVTGCTRCQLHEQRTQTVFGVGNPQADLVFVGEGPGADEDRTGEPFVGKAGQLLTRMIAAMTLTRDQVYICNIVKCRPPGNRTPTPEEMTTCLPYLVRQLALIRPKIIVTLGRPASQTLLATTTPISRIRGTMHDFPPPSLNMPGMPTCKLMPTFHPAYLLRSPNEKGKAWADLQQVMEFLAIPLPARDRS